MWGWQRETVGDEPLGAILMCTGWSLGVRPGMGAHLSCVVVLADWS